MQFSREFNYLFYILIRIYFILNLTFLISDAIKNRKILLLIKLLKKFKLLINFVK